MLEWFCCALVSIRSHKQILIQFDNKYTYRYTQQKWMQKVLSQIPFEAIDFLSASSSAHLCCVNDGRFKNDAYTKSHLSLFKELFEWDSHRKKKNKFPAARVLFIHWINSHCKYKGNLKQNQRRQCFLLPENHSIR